MGIYLNQDNTMMYNSKTYSKIYIDKSMLIDYTNGNLFGENKAVCISRPRRFGKSMAANMLVAYYSRGCDSKELFSDLKIAKTDDFTKHINKYNVIHFTMTDYSKLSVDEMVQKITRILRKDLLSENPDMEFTDDEDLVLMLLDVFNKTKIPFVFVIDEWDCIMRKKENNESIHVEYLDFLRNLLKDQPYVALAYLTGILPVKKYGEHSALNMFKEYSMENQYELSEFTGFTKEEVEGLCERFHGDFLQTKKWYNGYWLGGMSIYNPRSVVSAMENRAYESYWTKTETYEALKKYILINMDGLKAKVQLMIAGEQVPVNTDKFQNDMIHLNSADDVLTLLIHLGYLTYDNIRKVCWIPNKEVEKEFINCIDDEKDWSMVMNAIQNSEECLQATLNGDAETVARIVEQTHQENTSIIKYNDENSLACIVTLSYYTAKNQYEIIRELPSGKGYADIAFLPRKNESLPAIVVELKSEQSESIALEQIKKREYSEKLSGFSGEIILVGINYSTEKGAEYKHHTCVIEKVMK